MSGAAGGGGRRLSKEELEKRNKEQEQIIEELEKRDKEKDQIMVQLLQAGNKGEAAETYTKCVNHIDPCVRQDTLCRTLRKDVTKDIIYSAVVDPKTRIPIGDIDKKGKSHSDCKCDTIIEYQLEEQTKIQHETYAIKSIYDKSRPTLANSVTPDGEIFQDGEPFADMHPFVLKWQATAGTNGVVSVDLINSYCEEYPDQNKEQVIEQLIDFTSYCILDGTSKGKNEYPANSLMLIEDKPMTRLRPSSGLIFQYSIYNREETREFLRKAHRDRKLVLYSRKNSRAMSIRLEHERKPKSINYKTLTEFCRMFGIKGKVTGKNCVERGKFVCEKLGCEHSDDYVVICESIRIALGVDSCAELNKMEDAKIKELVDKRLLEIESSKST